MLRQTITDSLKFFISHWKVFLLIYTPIFFLQALEFITASLANPITHMALSIVYFAAMLAILPVVYGASIYYMAATISDDLQWPVIFQLIKKNYLSLLVLIIGVYVATVFGLICLILPGIVIFVKMSFSSFELLLNNSSPAMSIENSWHQTKGYFDILLGGMLLIIVPVYIFYYCIYTLLPEYGVMDLFVYGLGMLVEFLVSALLIIFCFRIYDLYKSDARATQDV
ncbi:MAG TPA: hypothetical protein VIC08_06945 [Cellvibrionaceae bacterium]